MVQTFTTTGSHPDAPAMVTLDLLRRPLRDLLMGLSLMPVTPSGQPDYGQAEPDLLVRLAESAELVLNILHGGFSAIGLLYACTAVQIANGDIGTTPATAIGRLQVELGEALAYVQALAFECRRYTADYVGGTGDEAA